MRRTQKADTWQDALAMRAAAILPNRVCYWVFQQVGALHCGGPNYPTEITPEVPFMTVLGRIPRS